MPDATPDEMPSTPDAIPPDGRPLPRDLRIHGDGTRAGTIARFGGTTEPLEILSYECERVENPDGSYSPAFLLTVRLVVPPPDASAEPEPAA